MPIRSRLWLGAGLVALIAACGGAGAPSVKLSATPTSLEDGQVITLKAEVTGAGKMVVEFFKGSEKVGVDDTAPYETSLPLTANDNVTLAFTAKATATGGLAGTSAAVDVQLKVDKEAPKVELSASSPKLNAAGSITLMVKATDNKGVVKVEFYKGSNKLGESTTPTDGMYSLNVALDAGDNGTHKYSAKAFDKKGNVGTAEVNVEVDIDVTKPTISLSADKTTVTSAGNVLLTAAATDNVGVTKVEFFKGEDKIGEDTEAPFTLGLNFTAVNNGNHTYSAKAYDAKDNSNTSSTLTITVDIDIKNPSVSLSANPTSVTAAGDVVLTADASDDKGVVKVEFFKGEDKIGEDTEAPYTHTFTFPHTEANNGPHGYTAKAYDAQSNTAESAVLSLSVDIDATNPTIHSFVANPTSLNAADTVTLSVAASDQHGMAAADLDNSRIAKVEFYKGTEKIGEDTTRNDGFSHTLNYDASYQNKDSFSAKVFDVAGNSTTSSPVEVSIDIDIDSPTVSLGANAEKLTQPSDITLTAGSSDNRAVTKLEIWRVKTGGDELLKNVDNPTGDVEHELKLDGEDNGIVKFYAKAYDAKGNQATSTPQTAVEVEIKPDILFFRQVTTQSTTIALTDAGGTVDLEWDGGNVLDYSLEISPAGTSHVIPTPGQPSGSNTSGRVTLPRNISNADITYTVTLKAKSYGTPGLPDDTQTLTITVAKDTTLPTISLSKEPTTTVTAEGDVVFTATVSDHAGIEKVEFFKSGDTNPIHTDTEAPFEHTIHYTAANNATHTYTAKATDKNANTKDSNAVDVTVDIRGALTVTISGLPGGTNANVTVTGPDSFSQNLTATATLSNLKPGNYTITPASVDSGNYSYGASGSTVSVAGGSTANGTVSYAANTGALTVTITGLPSGQNVTVTGPNSFSQNITATHTFKKLAAGSYTISAPDVSGYTKTVTGSPASVTAGNTAAASVGYVNLSGLWVANAGNNSIYKYNLSDLNGSGSVNLAEAKTISGLNFPGGMAFDASGNLWVTNNSGNNVHKYNASDLGGSGSATPAKTITGLSGPFDLAFDASGNLWVGNYSGDNVVKYNASDLGGTGSVDLAEAKTISGLSTPTSIAFDVSGNLWVSSYDANIVLKYNASDLGGTGSAAPTKTITGFDGPSGIAFDASGNLWVVGNSGSGNLVKYNASDLGGSGSVDLTEAKTITGMNGSVRLAFDVSGNLWVARYGGANTVQKFSASDLSGSGSATPTFTITGLNTPSGLAFNPTPANLPLNGYKP